MLAGEDLVAIAPQPVEQHRVLEAGWLELAPTAKLLLPIEQQTLHCRRSCASAVCPFDEQPGPDRLQRERDRAVLASHLDIRGTLRRICASSSAPRHAMADAAVFAIHGSAATCGPCLGCAGHLGSYPMPLDRLSQQDRTVPADANPDFMIRDAETPSSGIHLCADGRRQGTRSLGKTA